MIFGDIVLDQARGAVLAHGHRLPDRVLKKGNTLDDSAIQSLRSAGYTTVIAAKLEAGDVPENDAAERVSRAISAPLLSRKRATTGRLNLHADAAGILRVDAALIDRINLTDEAVTVATLPDFSAVAAGDMVATIKIIPFAVSETTLARVEAVAREAAAMEVHPFKRRVVGLVVSELPGLKATVIEGTIAATEARVSGLGGRLLPVLRCPHNTAAIAAALKQLVGADILLVAGASATVDRRDVGPAAVVAADGEIVHFGMPVDPGNLICLGKIGAVPTLVLPGCARSPKSNGIDWVLARLFAGLPVGPAEVMRMGVGGLLKDTDARPLPRARAVSPAASGVAAVVLAAGQSTRMAPYHKLLVTDRSGKTMIARVVDNILSSAARPVVVVLGHRADEVRAALVGRPVTFLVAEGYARGLSASLQAGISALPEGIRGALVCLGDMPLVTGRLIDKLIAAYDPVEGRTIVVPVHEGKTGNPILWDAAYFSEILALSGDVGARSLLKAHIEQVAEIDAGDDSVLRDFDTVDSLATLPSRLRPVS